MLIDSGDLSRGYGVTPAELHGNVFGEQEEINIDL